MTGDTPQVDGDGVSEDRLSFLEQQPPHGQQARGVAGPDGSQMVAGLIQALSGALVFPDIGNFETNKRLWNRYADEWSPGTEWVSTMAGHVDGGEEEGLEFVGDEWSRKEDLAQVVKDFILPYVGRDGVDGDGDVQVAEIGVGGGRVAAKVLPLISSLTCFDISRSMLERAKAALSPLLSPPDGESTGPRKQLSMVLLDSPDIPGRFHGQFDFIYCFDVMVHMDLHLIYRYFREVHKMLKPGGKAFFSTANLLAPEGWKRFAKQSKYTVGGFYFLCPQMVDVMLDKAGFDIVKTSSVPPPPPPSSSSQGGDERERVNVYYNRDYLVLVSKRVGGGVVATGET